MRFFLPSSLIWGAVLLFGSSAYAQVAAPAGPKRDNPVRCTGNPGAFAPMFDPVAGAPYAAVREISTVKILADGTRISPKPTVERYFRDSQGRDRTERPLCGDLAEDSDAILVSIRDPVAGYAYHLDQQRRIAYRYALRVTRPGDRPAADSDLPVRVIPESEFRNESLGSQSIEGIFTLGTRSTRTIPAGAEDNDRPITVVTEYWRSPDLGVSILAKVSDPRDGEHTTRLTDISRAEPGIALFRPPADYTIQDATGRVTITYTRP